MWLNWPKRAIWLRLALLLMLISGCSTPRQGPPVVIPAPQTPPLPQQARQPALPAWCSPTCSDGLTQLRESWRRRLIGQPQPAGPASSGPGQ